MGSVETAVATFKEGFSCSQAVLSAFVEDIGLDREAALKLAAGFGGGMGRMGLTCGAVTGAFMVIGARHGGTKAGDKQSKEETYRLVREFSRRFKERNGSIACRELLGFDISAPEGFEQARKAGLVERVCPRLVSDAATILEEMLGKF